MTYDDLVRFAQALGDSLRASRRTTNTVGFRKPDTAYVKPKQRVLSVDTDSIDTMLGNDQHSDAVLAMSAYTPSAAMSGASSTASGYTSSGNGVTTTGPTTGYSPTPPSSAPSPPGSVLSKRTGNPQSRSIGYALSALICWFCLSREHSPSQCPLLPQAVRDKMLEQRNANFRSLSAQGLNPLTGKPRGPRPGDTATVAMVDPTVAEPTEAPADAPPGSTDSYHTATGQENA